MMLHPPYPRITLILALSFPAIILLLLRQHVNILIGETRTMPTIPSWTIIQQQFPDIEDNGSGQIRKKITGYPIGRDSAGYDAHNFASSDYDTTSIDASSFISTRTNNEGVFSTILSTTKGSDTSVSTNNATNQFNPKSRIITNDIPWYDSQGNIMETNKGGRITAIRTTTMNTMSGMNKSSNDTQQHYYWLGSLPSGHILIYKSSMLGSNSWTLEKKIKVDLPEKKKYTELGNCQLRQHPTYYTNHIFCKGRMWFIQKIESNEKDLRKHDTSFMDNIHKNITIDPSIGTYELLPMPQDPSSLNQFKWVAQSTYQENDNLYLIVSRCHHEHKSQPSQKKTLRKMFIYKLNDQWTDFDSNNDLGDDDNPNLGSDSEIVSFEWESRESPWMIKRNNTYYIFVSQTRGWKQSKTFFKRSNTMIGLKDAMEESVIMHPHDTINIMSMGSQFRFVMKMENIVSPKDQHDNSNMDTNYDTNHNDSRIEIEKWIFGGDRYPNEAPEYWDCKYGRHVIVPMIFIDGIPNVYWKKEFDWMEYKYDGDFDENKHEDNGYAPTPSISSSSIDTLVE